VESRDRARPRGSQALRRELALKGIDRETIDGLLTGRRDAPQATDSATADFFDQPGSPEERAADKLLLKHRVALARVTDLRLRRQRAYALLARNGFDPEICRDVSTRWAATRSDGD
jgi:SOS response regulatory protein OraA/RecX